MLRFITRRSAIVTKVQTVVIGQELMHRPVCQTIGRRWLAAGGGGQQTAAAAPKAPAAAEPVKTAMNQLGLAVCFGSG